MKSIQVPRPHIRIALAIVGVAVVGLLDYVSGVELRVYPLYFLPLSLGAWSAGRRWSAALAVLAAATWGVSNSLAGLQFSHPSMWVSNIGMQAVGFATVTLLIAELRKRLDAEASLSRIDPLTQLANPRAFRERLDLVLALARRVPRPTTVAYIDLDNFKTVNDTKGHAEGDAVLRAVAECVRACTRATDITARIGGDELAVVLPETDRAAATIVLERFRQSLANAMERGGWPVTASIGALVIEGAPPSADALLTRVDDLMYRAKREGKNRLAIVDDQADADDASPSLSH